MTKTIFIVRHGETEYNKLRRVQGSGIDSSLNEKGRAQARAFYDFYKNEPFEVVLTSDLVRTHETAEHFIKAGLPWEQWTEIQEMSWGDHEGKESNPQMIEDYKAMIAEWERGNIDARIANGESARELAERLNKFINNLKTRTEQHILVFSHGRAMRCLVTLMKGQDLGQMENKNHHNTGLYKATFDGESFSFELENDTKHLERVEG